MAFFAPLLEAFEASVVEDVIANAFEIKEVGSVEGLAEAWYDELESRTGAMTKELVNLAREATDYMKQNAPWQDVSGRARASLYCRITVHKNSPKQDGDYFTIDVDFGYDDEICDYGEFLESSHFAIVRPTATIYTAKIDEVVAKYWS